MNGCCAIAKSGCHCACVQVEVARLYQEAKVNPLAGCLPTLITLPVWIGLYRALSNVADEGLLTEGFFWIPSLAGPTTLAAQKAVRMLAETAVASSQTCRPNHLFTRWMAPQPFWLHSIRGLATE